MARVSEEAETGRRGNASGTEVLIGAAPWFALVTALVFGGLLFAARAGDAYTHVSGLLFAAFGLLFGARLLHRLLP